MDQTITVPQSILCPLVVACGGTQKIVADLVSPHTVGGHPQWRESQWVDNVDIWIAATHDTICRASTTE